MNAATLDWYLGWTTKWILLTYTPQIYMNCTYVSNTGTAVWGIFLVVSQISYCMLVTKLLTWNILLYMIICTRKYCTASLMHGIQSIYAENTLEWRFTLIAIKYSPILGHFVQLTGLPPIKTYTTLGNGPEWNNEFRMTSTNSDQSHLENFATAVEWYQKAKYRNVALVFTSGMETHWLCHRSLCHYKKQDVDIVSLSAGS